MEIEEFGKCFGTPEFIEGTTAFMEKRKAEFRKQCLVLGTATPFSIQYLILNITNTRY